jgi:hypothetical protein
MNEQWGNYEAFDIREFERQEARMIELACYLVTREKDRIAASWESAMGIAQEYEAYVTKHQFNYAVLLARYQPEYWNLLTNNGLDHYRELFGED